MRTINGTGGGGSLAQRLSSVAGPAAVPGRLGGLNASGASAAATGSTPGLASGAALGGVRTGRVDQAAARSHADPDAAARDAVVNSSTQLGERVVTGVAGWPSDGGNEEPVSGTRRPRTPLPPQRIRDARTQRLEAVLLLAREPLNSRKLAQFANLADGTEARTLVRKLNEAYDAAGRAFRVEEVASGYQLFTRPGFATWLRKLGHIPAEMRLSAPALETLAVIAYRQPVPRADIEAIRGVNCGEILRQLMERDLARISGRSDELGRPFLYGTTRRFLQVFGLVDLDELPRADKLRGAYARPSLESGNAG
jgi:segregation and condensation protein B